MDESITCECGNDKFWMFSNFSMCPKCLNEYVSNFNGKDWEYWIEQNLDLSVTPPLYDDLEPDLADFMLGVQVAEDCMKRGIYKSRPYFKWRKFWRDRHIFERQIDIFKIFGIFEHPGCKSAILKRWNKKNII